MASWQHPNHRSRTELPPALHRVGVPTSVRAWVHRTCHAPVVAIRRLPGASSTAVHALRLADDRNVILRRYVWEAFRADEPDAPAREVAALNQAARHDLPVPVVLASDVTGEDVGDGVPALVMSRVPGRPQPSRDPVALADAAADIHKLIGVGFPHRYAPWCRDTSTRAPSGSNDPHLWERALHLWRTAEPPYQSTFVHRDFHPGNVLFNRGQLAGVVDWANACLGPVGIDIATCRYNLADWAGTASADRFVASYEQITGQTHHPYWDIAKLVEDDWDLICEPARVRQTEQFLKQALRRYDRAT